MATINATVYTFIEYPHSDVDFADSELSGVTITIYDSDHTTVLASGTTTSEGVFTASSLTTSDSYIYVKAEKTGYLTKEIYAEVNDSTTEYIGIRMYSTDPLTGKTALIRARLVAMDSDGDWSYVEGVQMIITPVNSPIYVTDSSSYETYVTGTQWTATSDSNGIVEIKVPLDDREEMRIFRVQISAAGIDKYITVPDGTATLELGTLTIG